MLEALRCNMDIKHIGSGEGAKALIYYVTDYITKAALPTHLGLAALLYAISRAEERFQETVQWGPSDDTRALTVVMNNMLSRREVSHPQAMSYIVGGGDHYTSHRFRNLHLSAFLRYVTHFTAVRDDTSTPSDDPQIAETMIRQLVVVWLTFSIY